MKIDRSYGPQLDLRDGTIGDTKLVRRFVVAKTDVGGFDRVWGGRHGYCTYAEKRRAGYLLRAIKANNPPHESVGWEVQEWWCWPHHFDPICQAITEEEHERQMRALYERLRAEQKKGKK